MRGPIGQQPVHPARVRVRPPERLQSIPMAAYISFEYSFDQNEEVVTYIHLAYIGYISQVSNLLHVWLHSQVSQPYFVQHETGHRQSASTTSPVYFEHYLLYLFKSLSTMVLVVWCDQHGVSTMM